MRRRIISSISVSVSLSIYIEINHRRPHGGNGASYLPIHCDAAVGNPELNLIFTNRYDFPIKVLGTSYDDGALLMRIYRYHGEETTEEN